MAAFAVLASILALAILGVVLAPLWRSARATVIGAVVALALCTAALYRIVGTPAALDAPATAAEPRSMQDAVAQLEAELRRHPEQAEGWQLLARSYAMLERPLDARDAFARAAKLRPDDPDALVDAAQSRVFADPKRRIDTESATWFRRALELQPQHQRARWYVGVWQRQSGRPADAAGTWEPLLAQVDPQTAATLRGQIDAARRVAGLAPLPTAETATAASGTDAKNGHALTVKVALDPDFAARVRLRGDATVFVIARMPGGPPMPVAVEKHTLQELPLTVTLDDGDGPMPTQKLSALSDVEVIARLSASGNPMRQPGDLESEPVRVALPAKAAVELTLGAATAADGL